MHAECSALCKSTKACQGFVFDQIPSETRQQCRSELSSKEVGCCLLKTTCGKGQAKNGDTAVSFQPSLEEWCPRYHQIHSNTLCDPSGPIQTPDGRWHVFNDCYWCTGGQCVHSIKLYLGTHKSIVPAFSFYIHFIFLQGCTVCSCFWSYAYDRCGTGLPVSVGALGVE